MWLSREERGMDVKYINCFLDSTKAVLQEFGIKDIRPGDVRIKDKMTVDRDLTVIIGIVGELRGNIAYSMCEATAKNIVSNMMGGAYIEKLDEMGRSAIGEISNMIMGKASSLLEKNKIDTNITPPSIIFGKDMYFIISIVNTIEVNMETSIGKIQVNIGLEL